MYRTTRDRTIDFLKAHPNEKFTARELAEKLAHNDPEWIKKRLEENKQGYTEEVEIKKQIAAEINIKNWINSKSRKEDVMGLREDSSQRPRLIWWSTQSQEDEIKQNDQDEKEKNVEDEAKTTTPFLEKDMYDRLKDWLKFDKDILAYRIDEKKSENNKGPRGNKWLHPDLVGFKNLGEGKPRFAKEIMKETGAPIVSIYSFEVKKILNRTNVREAYFQAVSNSTWAHFGYLVAAEIQSDAQQELEILCSMHGIGVIKLDYDNPVESSILIPAKERIQIGWDMWERLHNENSDFENFTKKVRNEIKTEF